MINNDIAVQMFLSISSVKTYICTGHAGSVRRVWMRSSTGVLSSERNVVLGMEM